MPSTLRRPVVLDSRGHFTRVEGRAALGARLRELLETLHGEVEMEPELGSSLHLRRHDPNDAMLAAELSADTAEAMARWEPSLVYESAEVTAAGHTTKVTVHATDRTELSPHFFTVNPSVSDRRGCRGIYLRADTRSGTARNPAEKRGDASADRMSGDEVETDALFGR